MNRALHREEKALRHEARVEARHGHYGAAAHLRHDANMVHNERDHLIHGHHGHHGHGHHGHGHGHHHHHEPHLHHHHGHGHHHHHNDGCCTIL